MDAFTAEMHNVNHLWLAGEMTRTEWSDAHRAIKRAMLDVESSRVFVTPGQTVSMRLPYSEVLMHMGKAGEVWNVRLQYARTLAGEIVPDRFVAQLVDKAGRDYSIPVTPGEAGFIQSGTLFWFYED